MVKITPSKTWHFLVVFALTYLVCNFALANDSSQKLINKYQQSEHLEPRLIHSEFSSNKNISQNDDEFFTSLKQEWYQDKQGSYWYAWEEKKQDVDGNWRPVNYGLVKQGFQGYIANTFNKNQSYKNN